MANAKVEPVSLSITCPVQVSLYNLQCLLVSALEGGSNYWYFLKEMSLDGKKVVDQEPEKVDPAIKVFALTIADDDDKPIERYVIPFMPGGKLVFKDDCGEEKAHKGKTFTLDIESITKGTTLLANSTKYAHHWRDLIGDNADAGTADVWLQFCLFGDVIYG